MEKRWEAWVCPTQGGVRLVGARPVITATIVTIVTDDVDASEAEWIEPEQLPFEVAAYLVLGHGNLLAPSLIEDMADLEEIVSFDPTARLEQLHPDVLDYRLYFTVTPLHR